MCIDLQRVSDGKGGIVEVPCRNCSRCLANRLTDLAGRCFAEAQASSSFAALTLTYAPEAGARSQVLFYRDVQNLFKKLRAAGFKVRYIIAGEYGSKRGRAHWHGIFFFKGSAPALPAEDTECQMWKFWTHGFTYVQRPDYFGLLYVLKYAVKDDGSEKTTRRVMMSKKPPLGMAYWPTMARLRIRQGLPFGCEYTLPGARYSNGNAVRYWLRGASLREAYSAHRAEWIAAGKTSEPPVKATDYEAVQRMMRVGLDWEAPETSKLVEFASSLPWLRHRDFDRAILCANKGGWLVRLKTGQLHFSGFYQGKVRSWPVESIADAIATARGRRVKRPPKAPRMAPF